MTKAYKAGSAAPHPDPLADPLVSHCPHMRCRRAGQCRVARRRRCLALTPLRRSLIDRLWAELARQIG